ncbi:hypothetical protein ACTXT7_012755 [Hymenolepis weldensis]
MLTLYDAYCGTEGGNSREDVESLNHKRSIRPAKVLSSKIGSLKQLDVTDLSEPVSPSLKPSAPVTKNVPEFVHDLKAGKCFELWYTKPCQIRYKNMSSLPSQETEPY